MAGWTQHFFNSFEFPTPQTEEPKDEIEAEEQMEAEGAEDPFVKFKFAMTETPEEPPPVTYSTFADPKSVKPVTKQSVKEMIDGIEEWVEQQQAPLIDFDSLPKPIIQSPDMAEIAEEIAAGLQVPKALLEGEHTTPVGVVVIDPKTDEEVNLTVLKQKDPPAEPLQLGVDFGLNLDFKETDPIEVQSDNPFAKIEVTEMEVIPAGIEPIEQVATGLDVPPKVVKLPTTAADLWTPVVRTIVIGDVHGCMHELEELLKKVNYTSEDRLVFLGDLVDRGPWSLECLRLARALGAECCLGNHEETHLRWAKHEEKKNWIKGYKNPMANRGEEWMKLHASMSPNDIHFLEGMKAFVQLEPDLVAVHAGLEPGVLPHEQKVRSLTRVRWVNQETGKFVPLEHHDLSQPKNTVRWHDLWSGPDSVVYGHAVRTLFEPHITMPVPNAVWTYGLDTGCVYGGMLTAMILPGRHIVQVPAFEEYCKPVLDTL